MRFCLQVGLWQAVKSRRGVEAYHGNPEAGSGTGVSGLFRCGLYTWRGGRVFLCLHAARRCRVGVPAAFFSVSLSYEESFLVSPRVVSRVFPLGINRRYFRHAAVLLAFADRRCVALRWCAERRIGLE